MALNYTITKAVNTAAASSDYVRMFHGTLAVYVGSLGKGIDFVKCGNQFWATLDLQRARYFSEIAVQKLFAADAPQLLPGPQCAIYAFDYPITAIAYLQEQNPPWLVTTPEGYCFHSASSPLLQSEQKNIEITYEE